MKNFISFLLVLVCSGVVYAHGSSAEAGEKVLYEQSDYKESIIFLSNSHYLNNDGTQREGLGSLILNGQSLEKDPFPCFVDKHRLDGEIVPEYLLILSQGPTFRLNAEGKKIPSGQRWRNDDQLQFNIAVDGTFDMLDQDLHIKPGQQTLSIEDGKRQQFYPNIGYVVFSNEQLDMMLEHVCEDKNFFNKIQKTTIVMQPDFVKVSHEIKCVDDSWLFPEEDQIITFTRSCDFSFGQ